MRSALVLVTAVVVATSTLLPAVPAIGATAEPEASAAAGLVGVVNINTATPEQLELLPNIGPARASSIVAHRREHGPFERVDDLALVSGIGEVALARLRPHCVVTGKTTAEVR